MSKDSMNLEVLASRAGFNSAVRHMNKTIEIAGTLGGNTNLGDLLYEKGDENLSGERGALLLHMLLVDKLGYKTVSSNLASTVSDVPALADQFEKWKAVDLIAAYHHPDLGLLIANPKSAEELANFGMIRKRELIVIYAGKGGAPSDAICEKAAELAVALFETGKVKVPAEILKGAFVTKKLKKTAEPEERPARKPKAAKAGKPAKAAKASRGRSPQAAPEPRAQEEPVSARIAAPAVTAAAPAITKGPVRMTPMYSVVVANELFHNGNVEAWKRIIASYNAKYPDLLVFIYYEGERIMDINALFKWGKVKHGSAIQFAVSGNDIKDVAKLQRYLVQGASHQFEAFLHGPVNNVLKLFG
ncbi:hypothetical protein [Leadbettera azotonutricia]|uniref:Uncharacterized protein n=1 Tax=Leadbettera azotonutricia (strain ATCC BAA-888 / DSM 13862 / ZAS-9) TaxID=545695 RepID=F5Y8I1_LEAAZ|nr:hypothetical protein [Leadbettera azotonutricia]AEF82682.1 conserved hypothetical protein [Leadbettera azotonutricia ZAS-9]